MYAREVQGRTHTFGVSGKLIMNGLVMYDRETETLWSQILGEAVQGPLAGVKLEALPAMMTSWGQWRELHADTLVLDKRGGYRHEPYAAYFGGSDRGVIGSSRDDRRLPPKELVVGVRGESGAVAYPFPTLAQERVVNDTFEAKPLVVVYDDGSGTGVVFSRSAGGRDLTFKAGEGAEGRTLIVDNETGTVWNGLTGEAVEGALRGSRLERVPTTYAFWFGWSDYFPETAVYRGRGGG